MQAKSSVAKDQSTKARPAGEAKGSAAGRLAPRDRPDRRRNPGRWEGRPLAELRVDDVIERFTPSRVPPDLWSHAQPLAQEWVTRSAPNDPQRARARMSIVAQLLVWADGLGESWEPEDLLHPETLDRFVVQGCCHLSQGTQAGYRTQLRAVGKAVLGPALFPPPTLRMPRRNAQPPYSSHQVSALLSWARGLPSEHMRHNSLVLLAFGLGAGLSAHEISALRGTEVTRDGEGVLVEVCGAHARVVPVLASFEDFAFASAKDAGDRLVFRPERREVRKFQTTNFIARCAKSSPPPDLSLQRLRTTWIVGHLAAGVPPNELARAAGTQAVQLSKYFESLPDGDPMTVRRMLQGDGRP